MNLGKSLSFLDAFLAKIEASDQSRFQPCKNSHEKVTFFRIFDRISCDKDDKASTNEHSLEEDFILHHT